MKRIFIIMLLNVGIVNLFAQGDCDSGPFLIEENSIKEFSPKEVKASFDLLNKDCLDIDVEYGEMVNEFVFHCLTYSSSSFFKALNTGLDTANYKIVLHELENPISDIYKFDLLYCNVVNYHIKNNNQISEEVLSTLKKWICYFVPNCDSIAEKGCK